MGKHPRDKSQGSLRGLAPSVKNIGERKEATTLLSAMSLAHSWQVSGLLLVETMISVSRFTCLCKDDAGKKLVIITGLEDVPCPNCGGTLFVHGTCRRWLKLISRRVLLRLRVFQCRNCHKTHRELPDDIIPCKRYSASALSTACHAIDIADAVDDTDFGESPVLQSPGVPAEDVRVCDPVIRKRIKDWLFCFFAYARIILHTTQRRENTKESSPLCLLYFRLKQYTHALVNQGKWVQHCSVFTCPRNCGILTTR